MSQISIEPYFYPTSQNSLSEHSFEGVPASLYNLTKSVPDPFQTKGGQKKWAKTFLGQIRPPTMEWGSNSFFVTVC